MNRLGFTVAAAPAPTTRCACIRRSGAVTLMTTSPMPTAPSGVRARSSLVRRAGQAVRGHRRARWPTRPRCCASRRRAATGCARASCSTAARRSPTTSAAQLGLKPAMTLTSELIAMQQLQRRRARGLRLRLRSGAGADDHRHRRLRLCRRLSAPRAHRHAGAGQRQAHAHRWTRIDGHDQRRPSPPSPSATSARRSRSGARACRPTRSARPRAR